MKCMVLRLFSRLQVPGGPVAGLQAPGDHTMKVCCL